MTKKKSKAKLGRPRIKNPASEAINLRVTPEQKSNYAATAKADNAEMATWMKSELDKMVEKRRKRKQ